MLDGLDLELAAGEHVAVTGESGSGKSTLLAVLLGFVGPVGGQAHRGGVDLDELPLWQWRRQIAWVPQRPYLVRGTIADNLRLGDPRSEPGDYRSGRRALGPRRTCWHGFPTVLRPRSARAA